MRDTIYDYNIIKTLNNMQVCTLKNAKTCELFLMCPDSTCRGNAEMIHISAILSDSTKTKLLFINKKGWFG